MSCEQLRGEIDEKRGFLREASVEEIDLVACQLVLLECCPSERIGLTPAAKMLIAEKSDLADKNWQSAKAEAENMLKQLDNNY